MPRSLDLHFSSSGDEASLRVIDNTIVCYAFLSVRGSIVGSVWLYNHSRNGPSRVGELAQNPAEYVTTASFDEFLTEEDFHVNWMMRGGLWECGIYIRHRLHALVGEGEHPGRCVLAAKEGPAALTLRHKGA